MDNYVFAAVVIYNEKCENSLSCKGLKDCKSIDDIFIIDNSDGDFKNGEFCEKHGWQYIPMDGNKGLASAYNKALEVLDNRDGILVLLDDDTEIDIKYFDFLKNRYLLGNKTVGFGNKKASFGKKEAGFGNDFGGSSAEKEIYLPKIYDEAGLLSPCVIKKHRVKRAKKSEDICEKEITGINSGMAISLSLLKDYRFDERYFLDYIDHAFLRDMKKKGAKINVADFVFRQRFSDSGKQDLDTAKKRFAIFSKDFKLFCSDSFTGKIYCFLYLLYRASKLSLRHRSFSFIPLVNR